ncbi:hypothetical protein [Amycolatopsis pittospori]|uniref:hypothetical protein n=1 Tax=Amycolatopsis pittospori TaxID=2749434 RepID=UPI0015EFE907|nr:hypothetical protein [Amycolatopsis pittospori]
MRSPGRRLAALGAALLVAVTGLQTAEATSPMEATSCYWRQTHLPMPAGIEFAYVSGSAGTEWIVANGSNYPDPDYGIIWHNEQPRLMLRFRGGGENRPRDINANGTVTGVRFGPSGKPEPYVYKTFYRWLPKPAAGNTYATWINDRGDIAGFVDVDGVMKIIYWRAGGTDYEMLGDGFPVGIDGTGRVVSGTGEIYHADGTRGTLHAPAGLSGIAAGQFNEGMTAGYGTDANGERVGVVWDAVGNVVSTIPHATARAANPQGLVLGIVGAYGGSAAEVWRNGRHEVTLANPRPQFAESPQPYSANADVTADGAIIATPMGLPRPSYWRCS